MAALELTYDSLSAKLRSARIARGIAESSKAAAASLFAKAEADIRSADERIAELEALVREEGERTTGGES